MAAAAPARRATPARSASRRAGAAVRRSGRTAAGRPRGRRGRATGLPTPPGGHLIPLAVGRTAVAVRQLPDTRAIVGLTRGRAWIAVLGILLTGIVALNVATLSFTASAGKIDQQIQTLEQENSILRARVAQRLSNQRVQGQAAALGLAVPPPGEIDYRRANPEAIKAAAQRLAAASG